MATVILSLIRGQIAIAQDAFIIGLLRGRIATSRIISKEIVDTIIGELNDAFRVGRHAG